MNRFPWLRFGAAIVFVCLGIGAASAQTTTVSASYIGGQASPSASATLYLQPVTGCATAFQGARQGTGGGQIKGLPYVATVTNGAASVSVPDALQTSPNIAYAATAIGNTTGNVIFGAGLASDGVHVQPGGAYGCLQPTGASWSLDTYVPGTAVTILPASLFAAPSATPLVPGAAPTASIAQQSNGQYLLQLGIPGAPIPVAASKGTWASGTTYSIGDLVVYSGASYLSLASNNTGNQPDISGAYWTQLTSLANLPTAFASQSAANPQAGTFTTVAAGTMLPKANQIWNQAASTVEVWGNSITQGYDPTNGCSTFTCHPTTAWPELTTLATGWTIDNQGYGSSNCADLAWAGTSKSIWDQIVTPNAVSFYAHIRNDQAQDGTDPGHTDYARGCIENELAWLAVPETQKIRANAGTTTGTWTWNDINSATGYAGSNGATWQAVVYGKTVYLAIYKQYSVGANASNFTVSVDGNLVYDPIFGTTTWNNIFYGSKDAMQATAYSSTGSQVTITVPNNISLTYDATLSVQCSSSGDALYALNNQAFAPQAGTSGSQVVINTTLIASGSGSTGCKIWHTHNNPGFPTNEDYLPYLIRVPNLANGPHTVLFTCTVNNAAAPCRVGWAAGVDSDNATTAGPYVYSMGPNFNASFAQTGNLCAGCTDIYEKRWKTIMENLRGDGLGVVGVDVANANVWNPDDSAQYQSDGVHPTQPSTPQLTGDYGAVNVANAFLAKITGAATPLDRAESPIQGLTTWNGSLWMGHAGNDSACGSGATASSCPIKAGSLGSGVGPSEGYLFLGWDSKVEFGRNESTGATPHNLFAYGVDGNPVSFETLGAGTGLQGGFKSADASNSSAYGQLQTCGTACSVSTWINTATLVSTEPAGWIYDADVSGGHHEFQENRVSNQWFYGDHESFLQPLGLGTTATPGGSNIVEIANAKAFGVEDQTGAPISVLGTAAGSGDVYFGSNIFGTGSTTTLHVRTAGTDRLTIDSTGLATFTGTVKVPTLSITSATGAAPSTTSATPAATIYGSNGATLTTPTAWCTITQNGTAYKVPCY